MPSLVSAIKTALQGAEGGILRRSQLLAELKSQLSECGDKASRKEAVAAALEVLSAKGKVTVEGSTVTLQSKGEKRQREEAVEEAAEALPPPEKKVAASPVEAASQGKATTAAEEYRKLHQIVGMGDASGKLPEPFQAFDAKLEEAFGAAVVGELRKAGFTKPTPIQAQAWPMALCGSDLVAVAKTGSGKTLAFSLPLLCRAATQQRSAGPCVLVLAPTRELATQIQEVVVKYGTTLGVSSACVYGGVPKGIQARELRAVPRFLVATPGRLVDHLQDKATDLGSVSFVVLDEADRMLDMGFQPQLSTVFEALPPVGKRQVFLFSATWPKGIRKMAAAYLAPDHLSITIGSNSETGPSANTSVSQEFHQLDDTQKDGVLMREVFKMSESAKVVIFTNTKRRADNLAKLLWENGYGCAAIHGDKAQVEREKSLSAFRTGEWPILVATDVAARGLDIDGVSHVVNFDMPRDVEGYVHRIGRTGRAGQTGVSITFWNADYDQECAPALAKIARDAGQPVPPWLDKWAAKHGQGKKNWAIAKIAEAQSALQA